MRARPAWLRGASLGMALLASGCVGFPLGASGGSSRSLGTVSSGWLHRGEALRDRGPGFERARPGESTRFGTPRLIRALERVAIETERAFPGSHRLRIGDVGAPSGGRHPRHGSHRSGRDVDVLFHLVGPSGVPVAPRGRVAFSRFGAATDPTTREIVLFDDARNWHFVRTLLGDPSIAVQWIFCSRGVKTRLLRYALATEPDASRVLVASYVLHEPSNAPPHDDHFHVRIFCSADERAAGCRDTGPIWPWLRGEHAGASAEEPLDDQRLLELLDAPFGEPAHGQLTSSSSSEPRP